MIKWLNCTSALGLCLLLLFQAGGLLCVYQVKMNMQQLQQQRILAEGNEETNLRFSLDEFDKIHMHSSEVLIDGKLYDYYMVEKTNDHIIVKLIPDHDEDELVKAIGLYFGKTSTEKTPQQDFPKQLIQWLQTPFVKSASWKWISKISIINSIFQDYQENFQSSYLEIKPRPPIA